MYCGSRHLGKITGPHSPPISSNFRRWSAERVGRRGEVGTSKAGGTKSQQAEVHSWLAADAHGNKQTNLLKVSASYKEEIEPQSMRTVLNGALRYNSARFSIQQ
jgi:hypothetical protein